MIKMSYNSFENNLETIIKKYNRVFDDHLLYYNILMNLEDFSFFVKEHNYPLLNISSTSYKYSMTNILNRNIYFIGSDTIKYDLVQIYPILDKDESEITKKLTKYWENSQDSE